jgi:hypothetical protein
VISRKGAKVSQSREVYLTSSLRRSESFAPLRETGYGDHTSPIFEVFYEH